MDRTDRLLQDPIRLDSPTHRAADPTTEVTVSTETTLYAQRAAAASRSSNSSRRRP